MSDDLRLVAMSREQADVLEALGVDLMRRQSDDAMKVLTLSLAYKFAKPQAPPLPDNVVPLRANPESVRA